MIWIRKKDRRRGLRSRFPHAFLDSRSKLRPTLASGYTSAEELNGRKACRAEDAASASRPAHRDDIVVVLLDRDKVNAMLRQPDAALVEADAPTELDESLDELDVL